MFGSFGIIYNFKRWVLKKKKQREEEAECTSCAIFSQGAKRILLTSWSANPRNTHTQTESPPRLLVKVCVHATFSHLKMWSHVDVTLLKVN